jgi:hypothetical protein
VSRVSRTSVCDCSEMSTASAEVTQPEQARQSVKEIPAGAEFEAWTLSSVVTSYGLEDSCAGSVSAGLMHATPGEMKSFRVSAERIALMLKGLPALAWLWIIYHHERWNDESEPRPKAMDMLAGFTS